MFSRALVTDRALENREFRLARQGANCHVGLGHGSGESDKLYSSPKMGVTDVTVGVTVTSRLHRSYCCSRIPLLFCCYCSTLQHCSVPNVKQPYAAHFKFSLLGFVACGVETFPFSFLFCSSIRTGPDIPHPRLRASFCRVVGTVACREHHQHHQHGRRSGVRGGGSARRVEGRGRDTGACAWLCSLSCFESCTSIERACWV